MPTTADSPTAELSFLGAAKRQTTPPRPDGRSLHVKSLEQNHAILKAANAAFKLAYDDLQIGTNPKIWTQFSKLKDPTEAALHACIHFAVLLEDVLPAHLASVAEADMIRDQYEKARQKYQTLKALGNSQRENLDQAIRDARAVKEDNDRLRKMSDEIEGRWAKSLEIHRSLRVELDEANIRSKKDQETMRRLQTERDAEAEQAKSLRSELAKSRAYAQQVKKEKEEMIKVEQGRIATVEREWQSKLLESQKQAAAASHRAEQSKCDFEDEKKKLIRHNMDLGTRVFRLKQDEKSLLEEAKLQEQKLNRLQRHCAQLTSKYDAAEFLQARYLDLQYDAMRYEHNEYLSAVRSAEEESTAQRVHQQLESARMEANLTMKRASSVEELNVALTAERDDARDVANHALRVAWARFAMLQALVPDSGGKISREGAGFVDKPPRDDPMPQVQDVINGGGESVNGKAWQEPSAIFVADEHAQESAAQQCPDEEQYAAESQLDTEISAVLLKTDKDDQHTPTKAGSPPSANLSKGISTPDGVVPTSAAPMKQPPKHPRSWDEEFRRPSKRLETTKLGRGGRTINCYRPRY